MAELLCFVTTQMTARTHRGDYVLSIVFDDSEWNGRAYARFHDFGGGCESVGPCMGDPREVAAGCDQHAHAQPAHPPMLGWPAEVV